MKILIVITTLVISVINSSFHTVAIIATNDIHGGALPSQLIRTDTNQKYAFGGLQYMAQMIETIKTQYAGQVLYFDAGDQFQGGIQSSPLVSKGQIMNEFYNTLQVQGSAIGNHQFDFGPQFLLPYLNQRIQGSPNLAANLRSQKGEQNFLPNQKGQTIYELKSRIKIGVIGLATMQTPLQTNAFKEGLFPRYEFLNYTDIVIERSKRLKQAGAHAILILAHVGNDCNATNQFGIWENTTKQTSICSPTDEISTLINSLPEGTIDGVIQAHRHKFSHHFIKGVPVMGTINGGTYFNVMYLKFYNFEIVDKKIQGPIPVCQKIFEKLRTCNYLTKDQLKDAGPLVTWEFHGTTVKKHEKVAQLYEKWLPLMKPFQELLVINEVLMKKNSTAENDLGNLITNLMHAAAPGSDIAIINCGNLRTIWTPGVLQYQHFYNMFPFQNALVSFEMTGQELLDVLNIIQSGQKAFYHTYGLRQVVSISAKKQKKFISAKLYNGTEIQLNHTYRVATTSFLAKGGVDFKSVIGRVYTARKEITHGSFRDQIKPQLIKLKIIKENTLVDPQNPRLTVLTI